LIVAVVSPIFASFVRSAGEAQTAPAEQPSRHTIEAERFIIRNENRKVVASLGATKTGADLIFYEDKGNMRVKLDVGESGSLLEFRNKDDKRIAVLAGVDNAQSFHILDGSGKGGGVSLFASGNVHASDRNGIERFSVDIGDDQTLIMLYDEHGKQRAVLGVDKKHGAGVTAFDVSGQRGRNLLVP
jgi:hypothetical protein